MNDVERLCCEQIHLLVKINTIIQLEALHSHQKITLKAEFGS